jgi:multiple sugar transport system substrate-binding protein
LHPTISLKCGEFAILLTPTDGEGKKKLTEKKGMTRRDALKYAVGGAVVAAVAAGGGAYLLSKPSGPSVTETVTATATATATATQPAGGVPTLRGYVHSLDPNGQTAASINRWNYLYGSNGQEGKIADFSPIVMGGVSQDLNYKIEASLLQSKSPSLDCPNIDISWCAVMAENGWLEPLDDIFPADEQAGFVPGWVKAANWKGHVYAIPYWPDELAIWYRKDIFDKEGIQVPDDGLGWTWEEFYNDLTKLKAKYPDMYMMANDLTKDGELMNTWSIQMFTTGAGLFDNDGLVRINDPDGIQAAQRLLQRKELGLLTPSALTGGLEVERVLYTDEGTAMTHVGWDYVWGYAATGAVQKKAGTTNVIGRAISPHEPGKNMLGDDRKGGVMIGGWGWALSAASTHKKEAKQYLTWETSAETMKTIMLGLGVNQARLDLYSDPDVIKAWPQAPVMKKGFLNSFPKFATIYYPQIQTVVQEQMNAAFTGQKTAEDAQNAIAEEVQKITGMGPSPLVKK